MRISIVGATFVMVAAGAAGAGALNNVALKGSDALFNVVQDVLAACPGATGLTFVGSGQGNGDKGMAAGTQTVSVGTNIPATAQACTANANVNLPAEELLVLGLDGLSVIGSAAQAGTAACNGAVADCDQTTDPNAGIAYPSSSGAKTISLSDGTTYTFSGWRDALRVIFAGFDHNNTTNDIGLRNCNSLLRQTLANNWGHIFQGACTGGTCTQIQHVFVRDQTAGTADFFTQALNLPAKNTAVPTSTANGGYAQTDVYCNSVRSGVSPAVVDTLPAGVNRYFADYQDNDPIRRVAQNNEQVASRKGDLGLVLAVSTTDNLALTESFPTTNCTTNAIFGRAPQVITTAGVLPSTPPSNVGRCPNGDVPIFTNKCLIPVDASGNPNCFATKTSKPAFVFDNTPVDGRAPANADGRVYNAHIHTLNATSGEADYKSDKASPARFLEGVNIRLHQTKTLDPAASTCQKQEADKQLGCLVAASPCSIGFGGHDAAIQPGAVALKVNGLDPTTECVEPLTYPLSRKVYFNTFIGFENVGGQEAELGKCFANGAVLDPSLVARGFFPIPAAISANPYCEDFNEQLWCGSATNNNACANNAIAGLPTQSTTCGNGVVEGLEICDHGLSNGAVGDSCSRVCRLTND